MVRVVGTMREFDALPVLFELFDRIEAAVLRETMLRLRWNKTHAAKELGLSRVGLRAKLLRFGLEIAPRPALPAVPRGDLSSPAKPDLLRTK